MVLTQLWQEIEELKAEIEFPYHYGSYATMSFSDIGLSTSSFHTTMVLTQLEELKKAK